MDSNYSSKKLVLRSGRFPISMWILLRLSDILIYSNSCRKGQGFFCSWKSFIGGMDLPERSRPFQSLKHLFHPITLQHFSQACLAMKQSYAGFCWCAIFDIRLFCQQQSQILDCIPNFYLRRTHRWLLTRHLDRGHPTSEDRHP